MAAVPTPDAADASTSVDVSLVIPVFNEEEVLPVLFDRLGKSMTRLQDDVCEMVFVNDGSRDGSEHHLRAFCGREPRAVLLNLSRNFGHQAAITAGLHRARGRCVIILDADLQDPPELISALVERWRQGSQVVVAHRRSRRERWHRRVMFAAFYRILGAMSDYPIELDAGVFGLMDRRVVDQLLRMPEQNRFLPGMRSWLGFTQGTVEYDRSDRAAGEPKQTFGRLLRYAFDAIFSFSRKPLRLIWITGSLTSLACFTYAAGLLLLRLLDINVVPGFTTPAISILFLGGVQLVAIGVLGEYLGRIYDEVKRRPLFIVAEEVRSPHQADPRGGAPPL